LLSGSAWTTLCTDEVKRMPTKRSAQRSDAGFPVAVVIEHDPDDSSEYRWSAYCPALPTCFSEGRTREEALTNVREVLATYHDLLSEQLAEKDVVLVGALA